jgi:hypothetical protein
MRPDSAVLPDNTLFAATHPEAAQRMVCSPAPYGTTSLPVVTGRNWPQLAATGR